MNNHDDQDVGNVDPIATYLRQIAAVPLLSVTEEITLAERIAGGRAAARAMRAGKTTIALRRRVLDARPRASGSFRLTYGWWSASRRNTPGGVSRCSDLIDKGNTAS